MRSIIFFISASLLLSCFNRIKHENRYLLILSKFGNEKVKIYCQDSLLYEGVMILDPALSVKEFIIKEENASIRIYLSEVMIMNKVFPDHYEYLIVESYNHVLNSVEAKLTNQSPMLE